MGVPGGLGVALRGRIPVRVVPDAARHPAVELTGTLLRPLHRNDIPGDLAGAVICPGIHELASPLQGIAPPIGALGFIPHQMRHGGFHDLAREIRAVAVPVAEFSLR